ncbi:MAG: aconitase X catalytic domain-containing protein, partial [Desulfobacterales bacterium]|nr:aconitase X catalytic domain-containing protein [Desulfobacterales bacterium]
MRLTDQEKAILDGKKGGAASEAMALMVRYGEVIGAEEMCRVTWADLFCGAHNYLDVAGSSDFDDIFAKMALCTDRKVTLDRMAAGCICYSGVEPDCTEVPGKMYMDAGQQAFNRNMLERFVDAGVILSGNCIPYLTGFVPVMGEHFVSCESSAVLFMNSLWGAMGNGDGIEASFCAAVCGRTPVSGMHSKKNRAGTIEVKIGTAPATLHDWDMLGYALGGMLPPHAV